MLQPITPPPTITTWARLGKSVGMSRPLLVVMITDITSTVHPCWSRHVRAGRQRPVGGLKHGDTAGQHGDQLRGSGGDDQVLGRGAGPETVVHGRGRRLPGAARAGRDDLAAAGRYAGPRARPD